MTQRSVNLYICCLANLCWMTESRQQQHQLQQQTICRLFFYLLVLSVDQTTDQTTQPSNNPNRQCPRLRLATLNANYKKKAHTPNKIYIYRTKPNDNGQTIKWNAFVKIVLRHGIRVNLKTVFCNGSQFIFTFTLLNWHLKNIALRIISFIQYVSSLRVDG